MTGRAAYALIAVASDDRVGNTAGINWCRERVAPTGTVTVWANKQSRLRHRSGLARFVVQRDTVRYASGSHHLPDAIAGPVLMAGASMENIVQVTHAGLGRIQGVCAVATNPHDIAPWVWAAGPTVPGDTPAWTTCRTASTRS